MRIVTRTVLLLAMALAIPARAQTPAPAPTLPTPSPDEPQVAASPLLTVAQPASAPGDSAPRIHLGLSTGVSFSQVSSELGTSPGVELEGGVRVWRTLSLVLGLGYSQPGVDHHGTDPRLGSDYTTATAQREVRITIGGLWRLRPAGARVNGFGALGLRAYLLETITSGSAGGQPFLENRETSTRFGAVAAVGGELRLGPGALTGALDVGGSPLPHLITGPVQTTALGLSVGYRLFIR